VTGGGGFIGSQLVRALAGRDPTAELIVVDDFSSGDYRNLIGYTGDVVPLPCEEMDWDRLFDGATVGLIYHLASITDTTVTDQGLMLRRNVEGFRRALSFALTHGIRLVYASSAATYGKASGVMTEDQPSAPANVYGFSKAVMDNLARAAASLDGPAITGLRYFNVYGPGEAHKGKMASMVYQLYRQMRAGQRPRLFRQGEQRRDFVYVRDAVRGTILAGESMSPGVFNIGSGQATSFNEIVGVLNSLLGTGLEPEYIDNPYAASYQDHTQADLSRAQAVLGYEPEWSPARGIADYVAWLDSTGA